MNMVRKKQQKFYGVIHKLNENHIFGPFVLIAVANNWQKVILHPTDTF